MTAWISMVMAGMPTVACLSLLSHSPSHASAEGVQTQQASSICLDLGLDFTPPEPKEWTFWRGNQQNSELSVNGSAIATVTITYNSRDVPTKRFLLKPKHLQIENMTFEYDEDEGAVRWMNSIPSSGYIVEREYQRLFDVAPTIDTAVRLYVRSRTYPRADIFIEYRKTRDTQAVFVDIYCLLTTPEFMESLR